jgi:hypothetical protein
MGSSGFALDQKAKGKGQKSKGRYFIFFQIKAAQPSE